jgi:hypothetical protein
MEHVDFDAPLEGTGQQRDDATKRALGLRLDEVQALTNRLNADFSADAWGYTQLGDISDEIHRATASDQIRSAARGIEQNLLEARLHELEVADLVGPNGLSMPYADASINAHLHNDRVEMNTVAFFRAFGSALDCMAAVLIGAARIPMSLRLADMGRLAQFNPSAPGRLAPEDVPDEQQEAWTGISRLLDELRRRHPAGWYVWGLEMRNAMLHRGRGLNTFLPRPITRGLAVITDTPLPALIRYDYYLRKRPWLPDLVQLARADGARDVWVNEPVQATLRGLFERLGDMVAELAAWALEQWVREAEAPTFVTPIAAWQLGREPDTAFAGFSAGAATGAFDAAVVSPNEVEFFKLAEKLRLRVAREAEQD